ncbi:DUF6345 domain-containing protein [Sorangium sp. So ce1128]
MLPVYRVIGRSAEPERAARLAEVLGLAAWTTAAIEIQPDDEVIYAVMGAFGPGWTVPNYNDYFWDKGPVGPDLRGADKLGYWRISGTT